MPRQTVRYSAHTRLLTTLMPTYATGFVQDIQLACFAVILACMALRDRENRSLRWLAGGYIAGLLGACLDAGGHWLPGWLSISLLMEASLVGCACLYASAAAFVRRGERARWLWFLIATAALPIFISSGLIHHLSRGAALQQGILAAETLLTAVLLLSIRDLETAWPRWAIAGLLVLCSGVEAASVVVFLITGKMAAAIAPWTETAMGIVSIVFCSALPLGFLWMMNARLLVHLNRQSLIDPLTELLNRRGILNAAEVELARYSRTGVDFAVVVMDLDYFKQLNDRFGHGAGDAVLCEVSVVLRRMVRAVDIVGRMGAEEFAIILPGAAAEHAFRVAERLREAVVEHPFHCGSKPVHVTASCGIADTGGRSDLTWDQLHHEAELALSSARAAGRNVCRMYEESMAAEALAVAGHALP